jgi:hypothetical protein
LECWWQGLLKQLLQQAPQRVRWFELQALPLAMLVAL